ncbi:MAG: DUF1223 domain-containing protein [Geminicoccaceae bacterium]
MQRRHLLATPLLLAATRADAEPAAPVLVELFTSQGCSSCPRADAALARLAGRPDILPLAFHVTYWDRLGWRDTLGDPRFDERQRWYDRLLGTGAYTPQAVVAGEIDLVGSDPRLEQAIDIARANRMPLRIAVAGTEVSLPALPLAAPARLTAVAFEARHHVAIGRGENAGVAIDYVNPVRAMAELGEWDGSARSLDLGGVARAGVGLAIIAQDPATGRIHALGRSAPS